MKQGCAAVALVCAGVMLAADAFAQTQSTTAPTQANTAKTQPVATAGTTLPAVPTAAPSTAPLAGSTPAGTAPAAPVPPPFSEWRATAKMVDPRAAEMAAAYQIGPEDLLDISVWKNVELSRVVPVRPDGKVSLPLVNDIQAAGLTPSELRDQITTKLAEYIPAPEVSVMVREVHSRKVAVVGAVKMPGRYEMKSPMTVLEAIALAQGLTDFASRDRIVVLREVNGKTTQLPFNYRKIGDDGSPQQNFFLRAGDIVVVP
jgi:polysaccharide export outer membrane protein